LRKPTAIKTRIKVIYGKTPFSRSSKTWKAVEFNILVERSSIPMQEIKRVGRVLQG
jgi:hypothetical protein